MAERISETASEKTFNRRDRSLAGKRETKRKSIARLHDDNSDGSSGGGIHEEEEEAGKEIALDSSCLTHLLVCQH